MIMDLANVGTCPDALTKKVLTCKCEEILRDARITFPLVPRLTQVGVVLAITQNDSPFIFPFARYFDDKMQMHAFL